MKHEQFSLPSWTSEFTFHFVLNSLDYLDFFKNLKEDAEEMCMDFIQMTKTARDGRGITQ